MPDLHGKPEDVCWAAIKEAADILQEQCVGTKSTDKILTIVERNELKDFINSWVKG